MSARQNSSRGRQNSKRKNKPGAKQSKFRKQNIAQQPKEPTSKSSGKNKDTGIRLNKYISNSGICSRREADVFINAGSVTVNGKLITEMGYKVQLGDVVRFDGATVNPETKRYVLLNKPKNFITTMDDDRGRRTVMELVSNATKERIYPVGRLDRNTTGLLLFTNDGELAKKLTHPRHNIQKIYHAVLDKKLTMKDLNQIAEGFMMDDFKVMVDEISYIQNKPKYEVGVKIHSGRNRIVRRIFEHFNYTVTKLDRVIFAGLTKKDLPRGHWRHLTDQEVNTLKML